MLDRHYLDDPLAGVDAVDNAVIAAACAVHAAQLVSDRLTDSLGIAGQRAMDKLDRRCRGLL
jgi:hypothetical protein